MFDSKDFWLVLKDGRKVLVEVYYTETESEWVESRGEHFGSPCSEEMSETELEFSYCKAWDLDDNELEITPEIESAAKKELEEN